MGKISVWTAPAANEVSKGVLRRGTDAVLEKLDPALLNASLRSLAKDLESVLAGVETAGGFRLAEVEIGVEITAEGGLNLIGVATLGGKAGLTLRFEKD